MGKLSFNKVKDSIVEEYQKQKCEVNCREFSSILPNIDKKYRRVGRKLEKMKEFEEKREFEDLCQYSKELIRECENLTQQVRMIPIEYGSNDAIKQIKDHLLDSNEKDRRVKISMPKEDVILIKLNELLPRRQQNGKIFENLDYLRCIYLESFKKFFSDKHIIYRERVVILFKNFFPEESSMIDDDNFDTKIITDMIAEYVLIDDNPKRCMKIFDYGISNDKHTEIIIFPLSRWHEFIEMPFS